MGGRKDKPVEDVARTSRRSSRAGAMAPHSPATAAAVPGALNLVSLLHAAGNLAVQGLLRADVREDRSWDPDLAESEFEPSEAPGLDPEERAELEQVMGWRAEGPMPVALHSDDPTVLVVPSDATYEEVAAALAAEWTAPRTDWFQFVPEDRVPRAPDLEHRCVRILRPRTSQEGSRAKSEPSLTRISQTTFIRSWTWSRDTACVRTSRGASSWCRWCGLIGLNGQMAMGGRTSIATSMGLTPSG